MIKTCVVCLVSQKEREARFDTMGENCTRKLVATIEENSSGKVGRSGEKCASVYLGTTRKLPEGGAILPRSGTHSTCTQPAAVTFTGYMQTSDGSFLKRAALSFFTC